jgi:hypothetical protein
VLGGPPRPEVVKCLVGQIYVPAGEAPQQDFGIAGLALACPEPVQARLRPVHSEKGVGQRDELGPDLAAAVVQEVGEPVGEGAAAAEPAVMQLALEAAA